MPNTNTIAACVDSAEDLQVTVEEIADDPFDYYLDRTADAAYQPDIFALRRTPNQQDEYETIAQLRPNVYVGGWYVIHHDLETNCTPLSIEEAQQLRPALFTRLALS